MKFKIKNTTKLNEFKTYDPEDDESKKLTFDQIYNQMIAIIDNSNLRPVEKEELLGKFMELVNFQEGGKPNRELGEI